MTLKQMAKKGITWIENFFFNREGEHRESFFKFLLTVTIFAFIGAMLGGLLDKLVNWMQGNRKSTWDCIGFVLVQLIITSAIFYIVLKYIIVRPVPFDDWMINTFAGFLFTITFFTSQETLTKNSECSIP
jgi:ABC-type Fe3+-siderophore transport system permease subunit